MEQNTRLSELEVLAFDCQACGANPLRDRLLEVGWLRLKATKAVDRRQPDSYLIKGDVHETAISRQVLGVTGLNLSDFDSGLPTTSVWAKLLQAATKVNRANGLTHCPLLIHYARFELSHIRHLHSTLSKERPFPFVTICTYEIARRLLKDLPRKSLRAVAGYLGYTTEEKRRVVYHVRATAFIWRKLLPLLALQEGITHTQELLDWLAEETKVSKVCRQYPMPADQRQNIPALPGIYKMRRSNHDILYVGKAASLKQRINSYFHKSNSHPEHILEMLSQAKEIDCTITPTALEAALLENEEIKRCVPPYNIALRESERFIYFFSKDLSHWSYTASDKFFIGPILSRTCVCGMHSLLQCLNQPKKCTITGAARQDILDLPEEYIPEEDCFIAGMQQFQAAYAPYLENGCSLHTLLTIARKSWLQRRQAQKQAHESISSEIDDDKKAVNTARNKVWRPETVARRIDTVIRQGGHQIRRARLLRLLSESALAWQYKNIKLRKRLLIIENARIQAANELGPREQPPISYSFRKNHHARLSSFELNSYDRMRILATEIRRLVSEKRIVELRFNNRAILRNKDLEKVFEWL